MLRGGGLSEFVEKGKIVTKMLFSDNVESSFKKLGKLIPADVKTNVKQ